MVHVILYGKGRIGMSRIYPREFYLRQLRPFYRTDLIKVIAGIRRCGKSCLMQSVADELVHGGVPQKDIIFINLDKRGFRKITTADALDKVILRASSRECRLYLPFLSRVQDERRADRFAGMRFHSQKG